MEIHTRDYPDLIKNFPQLQTHRQKVASIPNVKRYLENRPVTLFWEFCPYACIQYFVDTWKDFTFWFGSVKLVHLSDNKQCSNGVSKTSSSKPFTDIKSIHSFIYHFDFEHWCFLIYMVLWNVINSAALSWHTIYMYTAPYIVLWYQLFIC